MGAISTDLFNGLLYKTKKTEATFGQMASQFFVTPTTFRKGKSIVLDELLHLSVGSVLGLPLLYILKKTGRDHTISKGLVASLLTWIFLYNGGQKIKLISKPLYLKTHYASVWNHIIYGLTSVKAMIWLADPVIFASSKKVEKETPQHLRQDVNYPYFPYNHELEQSELIHVSS